MNKKDRENIKKIIDELTDLKGKQLQKWEEKKSNNAFGQWFAFFKSIDKIEGLLK